MRVLVVEDEVFVRKAMEMLLESWGFAASAVASTEEAVALAARRGCPDVIIADYRLGGGDTGWHAIQAVRRAYGREIPAVIVTGDTGVDKLRQLDGIGVPVLHKPVDAGVMRMAVERLLARACGAVA